jgi:hypothetical protein
LVGVQPETFPLALERLAFILKMPTHRFRMKKLGIVLRPVGAICDWQSQLSADWHLAANWQHDLDTLDRWGALTFRIHLCAQQLANSIHTVHCGMAIAALVLRARNKILPLLE